MGAANLYRLIRSRAACLRRFTALLGPIWPRCRSARRRPLPLGIRGERAAARFLWWRGYHIVGRQERLTGGELDLVAVHQQTVVFVEVKTRRNLRLGHPAEAVTEQKQRRITRAALQYMKSHGLLECHARFDVVCVIWPADKRRPTFQHIQNAFEPTDRYQFFS